MQSKISKVSEVCNLLTIMSGQLQATASLGQVQRNGNGFCAVPSVVERGTCYSRMSWRSLKRSTKTILTMIHEHFDSKTTVWGIILPSMLFHECDRLGRKICDSWQKRIRGGRHSSVDILKARVSSKQSDAVVYGNPTQEGKNWYVYRETQYKTIEGGRDEN